MASAGCGSSKACWASIAKYKDSALEAACDAAWRSGGFRYRIVKNLLQQGAEAKRDGRPAGARQELMPFIDEHPVIRPLEEYERFVKNAILETSLPGE